MTTLITQLTVDNLMVIIGTAMGVFFVYYVLANIIINAIDLLLFALYEKITKK